MIYVTITSLAHSSINFVIARSFCVGALRGNSFHQLVEGIASVLGQRFGEIFEPVSGHSTQTESARCESSHKALNKTGMLQRPLSLPLRGNARDRRVVFGTPRLLDRLSAGS
jgi:hypothetical protein